MIPTFTYIFQVFLVVTKSSIRTVVASLIFCVGSCQLVYAKMVILATLSTLWCPFAAPFFWKCMYKERKGKEADSYSDYCQYLDH